MALDGVTVSMIVYELREKLLGGRIDKIAQPERDEVLLSVRSLGRNYKLLLSAAAGAPRLHITAQAKENPLSPPLFCMVLRKHILNGKILSIDQPNFERIVILTIESVNEMGDFCHRKLIIEIMGKHSNLILTGKDDGILDAAKHISFAVSTVREVLPGKRYVFPPSKNKVNPLAPGNLAAMESFAPDQMLQSALVQSFNGISPVMAGELCYRAGLSPESRREALSAGEWARFTQTVVALTEAVLDADYECAVFYDEKGKPFDFACVKMLVFAGLRSRRFAAVSEMLDFFYAERDAAERIGQKSQDLKKLLRLHIERCAKKKDLQQKTLRDIAGRDQYKLYGELITANIYAIQPGATAFSAVNFYDADQKTITVPLDGALTPAENAQRYFKRYNKEKRAFAALQTQIAANDEVLLYLEGVLAATGNSTEEADIEEIRAELTEEGFLRKKKTAANKKGAVRQKKTRPYSYLSGDGFHIYVGKNNRQNDALTLKTANGGDYWLHAKGIPGSHVIVKTEGKPVPERTLEEAARLAAYYSKARGGGLIPVDYTPRKHVKKPAGAKPGMVVYDVYQTAYVSPDERIIRELAISEE